MSRKMGIDEKKFFVNIKVQWSFAAVVKALKVSEVGWFDFVIVIFATSCEFVFFVHKIWYDMTCDKTLNFTCHALC